MRKSPFAAAPFRKDADVPFPLQPVLFVAAVNHSVVPLFDVTMHDERFQLWVKKVSLFFVKVRIADEDVGLLRHTWGLPCVLHLPSPHRPTRPGVFVYFSPR